MEMETVMTMGLYFYVMVPIYLQDIHNLPMELIATMEIHQFIPFKPTMQILIRMDLEILTIL